MFKLLVIATVVAVAIADVQPAIEALKTAIDNLDIPDERKALYKASADKSKECLEGVAADAGPERIQDYITKLSPLVAACSEEIKGIAHDHVEERKTKFQECMKEKVHGEESTLDEKQKENVVKVKACLQQALAS
ncbi:uncharacterized protein LOC111245586 [Varroa destructor]